MFGRRDRCLLVLSQLAGVPYKHLATLTAGDVTVADGTATITTPAMTWTLRPADDGLLCGPCAITRWLRILNLVVSRPTNRDIAQALRKAKPGISGADLVEEGRRDTCLPPRWHGGDQCPFELSWRSGVWTAEPSSGMLFRSTEGD